MNLRYVPGAGGKAVFSIFRIHTGSVRLRNCMKKRAADTTAAAAAGMQLASGETRRMPQQARRGMLPALRVLQALAQHHEPPHSPWTGRFAQTGTARLKIAAQRQARASVTDKPPGNQQPSSFFSRTASGGSAS